MQRVVLSARGQVVIPAEIRRRMGLKVGQAFRVLDLGKKIVFIPESKDPVSEGLGLLNREYPQRRDNHQT